MLSGPTHALAKAAKAAMAPAMEAEAKTLLMSAQLLAEHRQALEDMGHPQPPTRARAGKPAHGALTGIMKQKRAKPAGMSASWAKGRAEQGQLGLRWAAGKASLGGYHTKRRAGLCHRQARPIQLFAEGKSLAALQGRSRALGPGKKAQSSGAPGQLAERLRKLASRLGGLLQGDSPFPTFPQLTHFSPKEPTAWLNCSL